MNDKDEETLQAVEDMPETSESEIEPLTSGEMTSKPDDEVTLEEESPENDITETTPEPVPVQEPEPEPEPEPENPDPFANFEISGYNFLMLAQTMIITMIAIIAIAFKKKKLKK